MPLPFSQLISDFKAATAGINKLKDALPRMVGKETVDVDKENFRIQGYDDGTSITRWPPRKASTNARYRSRSGGIKGSVIHAENPILVQTGNLKNALNYRPMGNAVEVGVDIGLIKYAKIHNEGGTITIKARKQLIRTHHGKFVSKRAARYKAKVTDVGEHTITMPKRQYMPKPEEGPNKKMLDRIRRKIEYETDRIFKSFKR